MTLSWPSNDLLVTFSWFSQDFLMTFLWFFYSNFMTFSRLGPEFVMTFSWHSQAFLMNFSWFSHDFFITFSWLFYSFLMIFSWISQDLLISSHDSLMTFYKFFMAFSWLSPNFLLTFTRLKQKSYLKNLDWDQPAPRAPFLWKVWLRKFDKTNRVSLFNVRDIMSPVCGFLLLSESAIFWPLIKNFHTND